MKKFAIIALLVSACAFAQETATTESGKVVILNKNGTYKYLKTEIKSTPESATYLTLKDFKKNPTGVAILPRKIYVRNAEDGLIPVTFSFTATEEQFSPEKIDAYNEMLSKANIGVMYKLKNKYTYVPKKILMFHSDNSNYWIISIDYTAQNDYGATKDGTAVCRLTPDAFVYDVDFM